MRIDFLSRSGPFFSCSLSPVMKVNSKMVRLERLPNQFWMIKCYLPEYCSNKKFSYEERSFHAFKWKLWPVFLCQLMTAILRILDADPPAEEASTLAK